jgi:hypothetical protein
MVLFYHTLLDLLQITFQSLGESNPFSLREGQVYYLYTKGPVVIVSQFFCYAEKKNNEKTKFFHILLFVGPYRSHNKRKGQTTKKKAKQGIEPCTTDHETVMLPLHYFACQLLF